MEKNLEAAAQALERFWEEPGGHVVLDQDLRVRDVGPEYVRLTMSKREDLLGKLYVNTITEPNARRHEFAVDTVRRLCSAALKTHQTQKYSPIRIDIKSALDGHLEERWWQGAYVPVRVGDETYIVHRIEDVTIIKKLEYKLRSQRIGNYFLYFLVVVALGLSYLGQNRQSSVNHQRIRDNRQLSLKTCHEVQAINRHLYNLVLTALVDLHTPGNATYRFYLHHPDLKAQALRTDSRDLQIFTPKPC